MKLGIVLGSIRDGRKGADVASLVMEVAGARTTSATSELLDLQQYGLPLLTSAVQPMDANRHYDDERVAMWSRAVDACDAFVFLTAEYNHGIPGAFKNALDLLGPEWGEKTVGFVGYGAEGGVRAIEQWRLVVVGVGLHAVDREANLALATDWRDDTFTPDDARRGEIDAVFDAVERLAATKRLA